MKNKRQTNRRPPSHADNYWKVFEQNGSIGAFLMFHRTHAASRSTARVSARSKGSPRG